MRAITKEMAITKKLVTFMEFNPQRLHDNLGQVTLAFSHQYRDNVVGQIIASLMIDIHAVFLDFESEKIKAEKAGIELAQTDMLLLFSDAIYNAYESWDPVTRGRTFDSMYIVCFITVQPCN